MHKVRAWCFSGEGRIIFNGKDFHIRLIIDIKHSIYLVGDITSLKGNLALCYHIYAITLSAANFKVKRLIYSLEEGFQKIVIY